MKVKIKTWEGMMDMDGSTYRGGGAILNPQGPPFTTEMYNLLPPDRIVEVTPCGLGYKWLGHTLMPWVVESIEDFEESPKPEPTKHKSPFTEDSETRKEYPVYSGCLNYFPDALKEVAGYLPGSPKGEFQSLLADAMLEGSWVAVAFYALITLEWKEAGTVQYTGSGGCLYELFKKAPNALASICKLSKEGNDKHNPGEPLHWSRDKSSDHKDCIARHLIDGDWVELAWRALANLQVELEGVDKEPDTPEQVCRHMEDNRHPRQFLLECIKQDEGNLLWVGGEYEATHYDLQAYLVKRPEFPDSWFPAHLFQVLNS